MKNLDRYLIIALLGGYVLKLLALGASLPDATIVLILAASNFLYNSQIQNKQINELKQLVASHTEELASQKKLGEDLRNAIASVKISQGLRNVK